MWHAVEFSRFGRAPSGVSQPATGQPYKLSVPAPPCQTTTRALTGRTGLPIVLRAGTQSTCWFLMGVPSEGTRRGLVQSSVECVPSGSVGQPTMHRWVSSTIRIPGVSRPGDPGDTQRRQARFNRPCRHPVLVSAPEPTLSVGRRASASPADIQCWFPHQNRHSASAGALQSRIADPQAPAGWATFREQSSVVTIGSQRP